MKPAKTAVCFWGQMGASGAGVSPSPSVSTCIMPGGCGVFVGLALSCSISNGRLPGDSVCQPPESYFFSQVPYGQPKPQSISRVWAEARAVPDPSPPGLPLALPQGMSYPLPAAHTRSEDATAAAYLSLAVTTTGYSETEAFMWRKGRLNNLLPRQNSQMAHVTVIMCICPPKIWCWSKQRQLLLHTPTCNHLTESLYLYPSVFLNKCCFIAIY